MLEAGKKLRLLKDNISDILLNPNSKNTIFAQAIRQALCGSICLIADLVIFHVLVLSSFSIYIAALLSALLTCGLHFVLTKFYVFKNKNRSAIPVQLMKYSILLLIYLLTVEACLFIFTSFFAVSPLGAKIMSVPIYFIVSLLYTRTVFMVK